MKAIIIFATLIAAQATPWIAEPRTSKFWIERHESFKRNTEINQGNISVIFYGDSITEGWNVTGKTIFDAKYGALGAANYGIGGDKTENLLYRIADGETAHLTSKLVVLMIGTNNLGNDTNDDIVHGVRAVVELLLERLSSAKVLLLGILPRDDATAFTRVADINIKISKFNYGDRFYFLDMLNQFAVAWGDVDSGLFIEDKLHLKTPGYKKWAETMDHIFNELYRNVDFSGTKFYNVLQI